MLKLISVLVLIFTIGVGNVWGYTGEFTKCTGTLSSGYYVIGNVSSTTMYAINNTVGTSWIKYTEVTISSNKITNPANSVVWYYDASAGTIKNVDNTNYIYWTSGNVGCCGTTSYAHDVVETSTSGIYNVKSHSDNSRILAKNGTSGYRYYTGSQTKDIQFWKLASSKTLSSIAITTQPTKREYLVGQTFSSSGAVVRATYSDASTANVTASWTPTTTLTAGTGKTITASYTEGGVNKTATTTVDVYSVTVQVKDEDGNTLSGTGMPTASASGASITASASGNNYVFKQWEAVTAAGTSFASSSSASTTLNGNPTGDVTIKAVYRKPITVTYKANGQNFTSQTYGYGGTLAFPASNPNGATYSCTGKTFTGWVAEANKDYSHATTAPTYVTAGGSVTAAATYYAVFANASGNKTTKTDNITRTTTGVTANSTNYSAWSGKTLTSSATYAGQSAGGNSAIQLRNQSSSGVISTTSGGTLKKIIITWNSNTTAGRYVTIFGKATAYSQTSDLYNNSYKGTELGTISKGTSTELNVTGTYNYVGILASAAIYIDNIAVQWEVDNVTYTNFETTCCQPLGQINGSFFWTTHFYPVWPEKHRLKGYYTNLGITSDHSRIPPHLIYTMYIFRDFSSSYHYVKGRFHRF